MLGIRTVGDLIKHHPSRYEKDRGELCLSELPKNSLVSVRGMVGATRPVLRARKPRFEATLQGILEGDSGRLHLVWFSGGYLRTMIHPGQILRVQGHTRRHLGFMQMVNPKWEVLPPDHDKSVAPRQERLRPVYPAMEDLPSERIARIIEGTLPSLLPQIVDHLSDAERKLWALPPLADTYRMLHCPLDESQAYHARRRLAFDELLLLQAGLCIRRHEARDCVRAPNLRTTDAIDAHIVARLPFVLTPQQRKVINEIRRDLSSSSPMNRLLQGDVGAGKTLVALYALLAAVASRKQAALLAPTEILAEQHAQTIRSMLCGSNVRVDLLTGSLAGSERDVVRSRVAKGEVDILIGSHAMLSDDVEFNSLAVLVIDEQHRFGVEQRAVLRKRSERAGGCVPHTLVMTATPIPRTLSLTLLGDLDVSTIEGLPPGRKPVRTRVLPPERAGDVYEYVAQRLSQGDRAFIVVPRIDDRSDEEADSLPVTLSPGSPEDMIAHTLDPASHGVALRDVGSHLKLLRDTWLKGFQVEAMHGKLERAQREAVMDRFRSGQTQALVCTTVVEVGVDVPEATLMIVENADRFGLAQLHQLRGRIGRGDRPSLCVLLAGPVAEDAKARLSVMAETNDGFLVAERDFAIRGMGEIFGTRQSGLAPFRAVEFPRDIDLLHLARRQAREMTRQDPELRAPGRALLRARLMKAYGAGLGIADVG